MSISLYPALFISLACVVLGWLLRMRLNERRAVASDPNEQAQLQLQRLRDLTLSVAADVDHHAALMRQIGEELRASGQTGDVVEVVAKLIEANQRMHAQLGDAETQLEAQAEQIEASTREARTDALTQVANRRCFDFELRHCLSEFQRKGQRTTLLLLDVDHFKKFNDTQGHQAGDDVLRGVAKLLQQAVADIAGALVARYGGEEFAILFAGESLSTAQMIGEKLRLSIANYTFYFQGRALHVTASSGLAELLPEEDERALIRRADEALYAAKHHGRNCCFWNDGQTNQRIEVRERLKAPTWDAVPVVVVPAKINGSTAEVMRTLKPQQVFFEDLSRRIAQSQRDDTKFSLLLLQVDRNNRALINEGEEAIARMLRITAQHLKATMREMDHLALISDDTFALLLPGAKIEDAAQIGERVRTSIHRCTVPKQTGQGAKFTVSIGCAEVLEADDLRQMTERARLALETAVRQGRNRSWVHDGEQLRSAEELGLLPR